jgi:hypothetical protein
VPSPLTAIGKVPADLLFPFFHFISSILNGVVQHTLREYRSIHQEDDTSAEMDVVYNLVEASTVLLNEQRVILSSKEVSYESADRYFKLVLEVIQTVQDDTQLFNLYIQQYAQYFFLATPKSLAFRYLTERVSLLSETWNSLCGNILAVHVIGNRDRMPLMKLVSLQDQENTRLRKVSGSSFALSVDNWFHVRSINGLCEDLLATLSDTQERARLSFALRESIAQIPFLMASGIGKKSENSGLQLRRLSLIYHIGQSRLPDETMINILRRVYSNDDLSLQCFFSMLSEEKEEIYELMNSAIFYFLSPQWLLCVDHFIKDDLTFVMSNRYSAAVSFSALLSSVNRTLCPPKVRPLAFLSTLCRAIPCDRLGEFNDDGFRITVPRFVAPWVRSNSTAIDPRTSLVSSSFHESTDRALRYLSVSSCDYSAILADDIFIVILSIYSLESERMTSNQINFDRDYLLRMFATRA